MAEATTLLPDSVAAVSAPVARTVVVGSFAEGGRVVVDDWLVIETVGELHGAPASAPVLVPLALWDAERDALTTRARVGVRLEAEHDPARLAADLKPGLAGLALVAIDFPKFTDGRGYSIARLLRERHGYAGPLRATGDVLRDQIFYMLRCGFDEFSLKHPEQGEAVLAAWHDFSESYQTSVEQKAPWFARRAAA